MDNKLKTVDAETLLSTPMSKTMFIVDGLISQGVNVISGASKIGKSWLMLWLGLQVAQGNSIWGLPTLQCNVLYSALTSRKTPLCWKMMRLMNPRQCSRKAPLRMPVMPLIPHLGNSLPLCQQRIPTPL